MTALLKALLLVLIGAAVGFAVAWWRGPEPSAAAFDARRGGESFAPAAVAAAGDGARLAALERALAAEVEERAELEAQVAALAAELEALRREEGPVDSQGPAPALAATAPTEQGRGARRGAGQGQVERLIAAGFPPDRAEWIDRRTQELRMAALQAQYDAQRDGRPLEPGTVLGVDRTLRAELGEGDYERYLQALGRPTSVAVTGLLASSPAERSGLKSGDEIVAYDGRRVFDLRELNALTLEGNAGESVIVEVRRDGQSLQLVLPRGPLGIFGGGFRGPQGR